MSEYSKQEIIDKAVECLGEMLKEENRELRAEVKELREALESCKTLDRSREYEYGEHDRNGNKPGAGQRWKTPKEIAKQALEGAKRP